MDSPEAAIPIARDLFFSNRCTTQLVPTIYNIPDPEPVCSNTQSQLYCSDKTQGSNCSLSPLTAGAAYIRVFIFY